MNNFSWKCKTWLWTDFVAEIRVVLYGRGLIREILWQSVSASRFYVWWGGWPNQMQQWLTSEIFWKLDIPTPSSAKTRQRVGNLFDFHKFRGCGGTHSQYVTVCNNCQLFWCNRLRPDPLGHLAQPVWDCRLGVLELNSFRTGATLHACVHVDVKKKRWKKLKLLPSHIGRRIYTDTWTRVWYSAGKNLQVHKDTRIRCWKGKGGGWIVIFPVQNGNTAVWAVRVHSACGVTFETSILCPRWLSKQDVQISNQTSTPAR